MLKSGRMINITDIYIDKKILGSVKKVLSSKFLVQGKKVEELENKLKLINQTKYALVLNSGTAALHTALASIGIKKGDEVVTTCFSFIATANTILMCGAKPVFVDIEEETFNINPDLIEQKISQKTKAILTVDLYGRSCNYQKIKKIAQKYNLKVISDSAQAVGAKFKNKPIAKWVDIACFSFYATKNISMGEGGSLATDNKRVFDFAKRFRQHGQDMEKPYVYHYLGFNYRATDILAAIGLGQIRFLEKWILKRYQNAQKLAAKLQGIPGIIAPHIPGKREHVFHQFTIRITKEFTLNRDRLQEYLLKNGIRTGIYYPSILAEHSFIQKVTPFKKGMFPVAEKLSSEVLSLPVHQMLKISEIKKISSLIKSAYEKS